jgi:polyhydroxyalkanoate synthase
MVEERLADLVADLIGRLRDGLSEAPTAAPKPEAVTQWEVELERTLRRAQNLSELFVRPREPEMALTPREEIHRTNKSRLFRYRSARTYRTPVLFVPNLGISRPYIFDLRPGASFIEHMTGQGFDFYLLDWGVFGPEDNGLTLEHSVTRILPRMIDKVLATSGRAELSLLGYCMGAPLSASYLGWNPQAPVRNFINMAGPIDFAKAGLFGRWLDRRFFDVDRFVDTLGVVPGDLVRIGFKLLRPTTDLSTSLDLWWNAWDTKYVEGFTALNTWANEYVAFPGEFFRRWVRDYYQDNCLVRGALTLAGRPVRLATIRCPVFVVGGREDDVAPPACVRALLDAVASRDKEYLELPGGHISLIAGRGAAVNCWPKLSDWLAPRSG